MIAFERRILTSITSLRTTIDDIDRKLSRISASRGVQLSLPTTLPLKTTDDFDILHDWLKSESNKTDLVSCTHGIIS